MKKAMKYILVVLIIVSMLSATAMAKGPSQNNPKANKIVTITKQQEQTLINKINVANAQIVLLVRIAQLTPWNDVQWLLAAVDDIIADVRAYALSIGTDIGCVYTLYIIDGQKVLIDPIIYIPIIIDP